MLRGVIAIFNQQFYDVSSSTINNEIENLEGSHIQLCM